MFDPVDPKQRLPDLEEGILRYWQEEDIFKRSCKQRSKGTGDVLDGVGGKKEERFSFYDGPPFATGLPHYGHLLAGTIKDVIPRYQTMRGKYVERRFGWDCHGLPVENIVEKEQGLSSRKDIEKMGIAKFNELCRAAVQRYTKEWRAVVERMGRFVDMDFDYRTMDPDYMESIWWVFKQLTEKNLIYEGHKGMYICPRCATPLSNFEVTQGYADRQDLSVIVTFPLLDDPDTILLAWTTTPWSLPGNLWLAIGNHIDYVLVEAERKKYILARKLVEQVFKGKEHRILKSVKPKELLGKRYEPLFPYFVNTVLPSTIKGKPETYGERANRVVMNDAVEVSDEEGTGIVHITSSTGEDSYAVARSEGVDVLYHVTLDGFFVPAVKDFVDLHVKPEGEDPMATDKRIIEYLKRSGRFFSQSIITHSYPHCWRCDTPLIPYTTRSWFVAVEKFKDDLLQSNADTRWVPDHIRDGRFGKWLEGARDWAISRNRYWGTPLPIWRCPETGDTTVIGSRDELMQQKKLRFTKITVLRHGESEGNLIPIYQGKTPGTDLTERGKKQAQAAADFLKNEDITAIYCSPLDRTRQTAEPIAEATGALIIEDARLREVSFGEYEGKTVDFSDLTFVKARRAYKLDKGNPESIYHFPGMETWKDVEDRTGEFLRSVLPLHRGGHVVIVTHADPLQNMRHFFTGEDPLKLSHQPYPLYADPHMFFWDHETQSPMDLHKHTMDTVAWGGSPAKDQKLSVTFVRHGETDWNKDDLLQGSESDLPLNEEGRRQVQKLAKQLKKQKFDVIISSDLLRASETADILGKELGISRVEPWEILRERKQGEWSGRNKTEIRKELKIPSNVSVALHPGKPQGGESLSSLFERAGEASGRLLREFAGKKVIVVAHGGINLAMRGHLENLPLEKASALEHGNASAETVAVSVPGNISLTLVRHGQTDLNKQKIAQGGNIDTDLNEIGKEQARELGGKLKKRKFDVLISSDLKRAVETAEILGKELGIPLVAKWPELRERDTGDWTGKPLNLLEDLATPLGPSPCLAITTETPPNGESFAEFLSRLEGALARIRREFPGKRVLVSCHYGTVVGIRGIAENLSYKEMKELKPKNTESFDLSLTDQLTRIPEVLDCWFESGSMPYAQGHFPFEARHGGKDAPPGFPADFIAEGIDQTRGWFYTLMVLSSALFKKPAFKNCIVNGIVLAEDGKKMSKRLKNYPEPMEVVKRHGADAVRFTLMGSPAVRGEDLRFSEKLVEETVRSVLLPLWNVYSFFVTYANAANYETTGTRRHSTNPLDQWIRAEAQDLVNRMTLQLDHYELSAACDEIHETIDALTNWYVRLSRRRFAGKGMTDEEDSPETLVCDHVDECHAALSTLEDVLLTTCQILAPFCPFITDAIYLNLVPEDHGSIHLTDWPATRALTKEEQQLIERNRILRIIVSLGHTIRSGKKIKVRQPLARAVVALPPALAKSVSFSEDDLSLLRNELHVKTVEFVSDPGSLAHRIAMVDARKVGPRLGARVQELIRAGKEGDFTVNDDGSVLVLDETLSPEEVSIVYRGTEGQDVSADQGIVVSMDTAVTEELKREGQARDLVRSVQKLRKEAGLHFTDSISLSVEGIQDVLSQYGKAVAEETNAVFEENDGELKTADVGSIQVTLRLKKR